MSSDLKQFFELLDELTKEYILCKRKKLTPYFYKLLAPTMKKYDEIKVLNEKVEFLDRDLKYLVTGEK